jgi:hypothetical protein
MTSLKSEGSGHCDGTHKYVIGVSQNHPLDLAPFLQSNLSDSATKVSCILFPMSLPFSFCTQNFLPKLRRHLFPRIIRHLIVEQESKLEEIQSLKAGQDNVGSHLATLRAIQLQLEGDDLPLHHQNHDRILFQSDRIYKHDTFHVNYTSYDLRREQDVVNPKTSRCNVMCLKMFNKASPDSRFRYARVLGVFHVNVAYGGPGSPDMNVRRFDFLWVRWYEDIKHTQNPFALQRVTFSTISATKDAVDFLDPADVLRACHIVPRYHLGSKYGEEATLPPVHSEDDSEASDGEAEGDRALSSALIRCTHLKCQPLRGGSVGCLLSQWAAEGDDWKEYYVNM